MADESENSGLTSESLMDKIADKLHGDDSSSSSDSETEKPESPSSVKEKVYRLFGREKPVHKVLGGGKPADVLLWRNKKISATVLGGATAIWIFFELLEYHLLTLLCHVMILVLAVLFLWSSVSTFIHKSPPRIPEVGLPEEPFVEIASALMMQLNMVFGVLRDVASGRDLKKFLLVIAGLWVLSMVGSWCNFLTLFYTCFVLLHTVPALYEKYEHKVDPLAEKASVEMRKKYAVLDEKVLSKVSSKLPKGLLKGKSA